MREIKFRAWLDGEMYPDVSTWTDDYTEMLNDTLRHFQEREDERMILMQYTGLKDKNGKEIYEGDIIKREGNEWWSSENDTQITVDDIAALPTKCGDWSIDIEDYEVIGNIYENPDLLTK